MSISTVRQLCREGKINWSLHAAQRILERGISREEVVEAIMTGEVIEEYPDAWPSPAYLVFAVGKKQPIHVVVGEGDAATVVTAYVPSEDKFLADLKTRRGH